MSKIFIYLLQSAAILAVLYSVYWLFLRKDTFFHVNRFYLLTSLLLSLVIPLIDFQLLNSGPVYPVIVLLDPVLITPEKMEKVASVHLTWFEILGVIYLTGVAIFTLRLIAQLIQLMALIRRRKVVRQDGANIVFVDKGYSPFSFFNLIFIRKEYYIDGKLTPVIEHEKIHIRQYHTLDLLLIEIATIIQWFNPFVWLLGRSVKSLHEFLADEGVLNQGFHKSDYQTLILNEAMGFQINNLTNNFNVSLLKKRIKMMTKTRSASWSSIKVMMALPVLLAVVFLFAAGKVNTLSAQETQQKAKQAEQQKATQYEQQKAISQNKPSQEDSVFRVVETMPKYPGGQDAMIQYLVTNIKYPDEAKKQNIKGTVFVKYIVEKDGAITHTEIIRGIGGGCDEEAVRVVSSMPRWSPGKDNGKPVRVEYALPIKFALDDKAGEKEGEKK